MSYGFSWYGLSWYGLSNYRSSSINASGTIATRETLSLDVKCSVASRRTETISATGAIAASGKWYEIYARGYVQAVQYHHIDAGGNISELRTNDIQSIVHIATPRYVYIHGAGRVSQLRSYSIDARGSIKGYTSYEIFVRGAISSLVSDTAYCSGAIAERRSEIIHALSKIATHLPAMQIAARGMVVVPSFADIFAKGTISQLRTNSVQTMGTVSLQRSSAISARSVISSRGILAIPSRCLIAISGKRAGINARGRITLPQHYSITASGYVIASPYYYLNGLDITHAMLEGLKASGPEPKFEKISFPGRMVTKLVDQGHAPVEYSFDVYFGTISEAFDYVNAVRNPDGDLRFYPGDSLRFHKVKSIATERVKRRGMSYFVIKTTVYLEKPYLYADMYSEWYLQNQVSLPRTSTDFVNRGHIDMPLEYLRVVGIYYNAYAKGITLAVISGGEEVSSVRLAERLLSDEMIELDEDGVLTCTYSDDFSSCTRFTRDTTRSNASCSSGRVTISSSGYVIYELQGTWPLMRSLEMQATLNVLAGSPVIEVSTDNGATYTTAVSRSQIKNNILTTYYLSDTAGYRNVRVRFRCPSGASLEIYDLKFVAKRRVGDDLPKIAAGSTSQIQISDDTDSSHKASILARFRAAKYPI
jgi:hypothetical protein